MLCPAWSLELSILLPDLVLNWQRLEWGGGPFTLNSRRGTSHTAPTSQRMVLLQGPWKCYGFGFTKAPSSTAAVSDRSTSVLNSLISQANWEYIVQKSISRIAQYYWEHTQRAATNAPSPLGSGKKIKIKLLLNCRTESELAQTGHL
jgi:hypothetical protein